MELRLVMAPKGSRLGLEGRATEPLAVLDQ